MGPCLAITGREGVFLIGVGILRCHDEGVAVGLAQFKRKCLDNVGDWKGIQLQQANIRPDSSSNISDQICSPVEVRSSTALTRSLPSACWIVLKEQQSTAPSSFLFPMRCRSRRRMRATGASSAGQRPDACCPASLSPHPRGPSPEPFHSSLAAKRGSGSTAMLLILPPCGRSNTS